MAYLVRYEPELDHKYSSVNNKKNKWMYIVALCLIVIIGLVPGFRNWMWDFMIPGDPRITVAAFENMVSDVAAGENMSEVFAAFCREILEHA